LHTKRFKFAGVVFTIADAHESASLGIGDLGLEAYAVPVTDMEAEQLPTIHCRVRYGGSDFADLSAQGYTTTIYKAGFNDLRRYIYEEPLGGWLWVEKYMTRFSRFLCRIQADWKAFDIVFEGDRSQFAQLFYLFFFDLVAFTLLSHAGMVLHGVVIEHQNKAVILSAPSQTGKSTHAGLWVDLGLARVVNGDRALLKQGTYWQTYGLPWCGTSGQSLNITLPLQAIVFLEQSNKNTIEALSTVDGLLRIRQNLFVPDWALDVCRNMLDLSAALLDSVPVYLLRCRPDEQAVHTLRRELDRLKSQEKSR